MEFIHPIHVGNYQIAGVIRGFKLDSISNARRIVEIGPNHASTIDVCVTNRDMSFRADVIRGRFFSEWRKVGPRAGRGILKRRDVRSPCETGGNWLPGWVPQLPSPAHYHSTPPWPTPALTAYCSQAFSALFFHVYWLWAKDVKGRSWQL